MFACLGSSPISNFLIDKNVWKKYVYHRYYDIPYI